MNERALAFADLNARLNGIENVELRVGSLFEPAAGETFDLVVSNPPYVISPDTSFVYRDGGRAADEISREVVGSTPAQLTEGGFATILVNWVVPSRDDPLAPLESWVADQGCDAWLLHYVTQDAAEYAARWNEELRDASGDFAETVGRWLAYYEREGIEAVALGAVLLRRREGGNWIRREAVPLPPTGAASEQILRVFEAQDAALSDDELLDARLALVEPHRLDQSLLYQDGAYAAQDAALILEDSVGVRAHIDPHAIHVLFALDGTRPLRELVDDAVEATELDRDLLAGQTLSTARRLHELGFAVLRA